MANTPQHSTDSNTTATKAVRVPTSLKGRAAVLALALGAVVAGGQTVLSSSAAADNTDAVAFASSSSELAAAPANESPGPVAAAQVLNVNLAADSASLAAQLNKGRAFSEERAAREAAARRPLFSLPAASGILTSTFGERWGAMHAGIDIAAPIGTPILAAADGVVIEAGPASGFGLWVRVQHADGTVTVYGHNDANLVQAGQQVKAGDQIATVGNRGYSTGPHVHFEVWLAGSDGSKIDPLGWLAERGVSIPGLTG
jgi:murein DD-endopeptidase MepM/ murein hydrolase activator NlpD